MVNDRNEAGKVSQRVMVLPAPLKEVLEAACLQTITHYMDVHWQTITNFIVNQPIWELCVGAVRRRGLPIRLFWWDQPMDLDLAKEKGLLLPAQGPAGPAFVKDEDED